jgi:hypothetical protein
MNLPLMIVKKLLVFSFGMLILAVSASAQESTPETTKKYARPDIPGTFVVELGLNQPFDRPQKFQVNFWGSRTANIYYQYDLRILKSRISLVPGIGLSLERYKFKNNYVLDYNTANGGALSMVSPKDYGHPTVRKSQLITNYLEVPIELRFSGNPEDPTRSFKFAVGARGGVLLNSFTKVKYNEDGEKIKIKNKQPYNLNPFRYSLFAKVGAGNFSVFAYYNLTPVFKTGRGPVFSTTDTPTEMQNFTVGISLSSF